MNLTEELKRYADASAVKIPQELQTVMGGDIKKVEESQLLKKSTKKGDSLKPFNLPNATGTIVSSDDLLKKGKLVINFYRGGWCPYCNLELKAFQEVLPQINEAGATLIAITPEQPDHSLSTSEKNELEFEVLTDKDNAYARELHLVFQLSKELNEIYKGFGIDLESSNGNTDHELPIAATYVVDTDGTVIYSYLSADYKVRANPTEVLAHL